MDKQQTIALIEERLQAGAISREDLLALANPVKEESSRNLIHVFYAIGAIIALIGIVILIAQNWREIGFFGRIVVTLGISLATYVAAILLRSPEQRTISQVMFTMSAMLAPVGAVVLLSEADMDFTWVTQIFVATILFVVYAVALFISKKNILVLFSVAFASWAYYALVMKMFAVGYYYETDFLKWATMLLGFSYLLIGYGLKMAWQASDDQDAKEKSHVGNVLYAFGTLAILGAGISVGGVFDLVLIALIFGAFYGSVYLKSRAMLTLAALFLMAHIVKLTSEYFVDSIGWPVALIVVGFLVIGIGYMTYSINKKYLKAS